MKKDKTWPDYMKPEYSRNLFEYDAPYGVRNSKVIVNTILKRLLDLDSYTEPEYIAAYNDCIDIIDEAYYRRVISAVDRKSLTMLSSEWFDVIDEVNKNAYEQ